MLNDTLLQDYITATVTNKLTEEKENMINPTMIIEHDFPEDNKIIVFCPCGGTFEGEQGDVNFCPKCGSTINIDYPEDITIHIYSNDCDCASCDATRELTSIMEETD